MKHLRMMLVVMAAFIIVSCAPAAAQTQVVTGGTFVRAMTSEPASIDPQGAATSGLSLIAPYLFDTLATRDVNNKLVPLLAESWQVSEDGKTITMKLKSGVTFQDGTPMNAEAVRFTFQRFKDSGTKSPIYSGIKAIGGIEAVDNLTVKFTFKDPTANFWGTITMPYAGIISPDSAKTGKGNLIGTGPFMLGEWKTGQSITLKRNPDYKWGTPITQNRAAPYLDNLVFKVIPEASTQLAALETGDIDAIFINQPDHRAKLLSNPNVQLVDTQLNSLIYLAFNNKKAPFDDARVRRALSYAINKDEIVKVALGGIGKVASTYLPPTLSGYDASLKSLELGFDLKKAQAELKDAGFSQSANGTWEKNGQPLKGLLITSNRAPNDSIAALIQSQFKAIGVAIDIQQLDSKAVTDATAAGKFDFLVYRYEWNDPDALNIYLGSANISSTNRAAYSNPEVDKLLAQGARELDEGKRAQIYAQAQKLILQDAPWQPLYIPVDVLAFNKRFGGVQVGYMGRMLMNDVQFIGK
ncbi:MAG: ABC transporter substrate-binding protein [Chloroflexi bacterium]|nr:ABC transporter substrate-binding protein [Chloroflexota bacterium]